MEIYYIHIKGYNHYKDSDVNFGGQYRIFYDESTRKLRVEENQHYVKDFFKSSLSNGKMNQAIINKISCVVGENGAGKSSLLNFIKYNFIRGVSWMDYPVVIALRTQEGEKIVYYFDDATPILEHNCEEFGFILKPIRFIERYENNQLIERTSPSIPKELANTDFIFVSNVFDSVNETELSGLYNLSTNFLLQNDKRRLVENHITKNYANEVETHRIEDVVRQVNFIYSYSNSGKYINFDLPENLSFIAKQERDFVNNGNAKSFIDSSSTSENPNLKFIESLLYQARNEIKNSKDERRNTLTTFFTNCLINFLIEIHRTYGSVSNTLKVDFDFTLSDFFKQFQFSNDYHSDLHRLILSLKEQSHSIPPSIDQVYYNLICGIENYFNLLNEMIEVDTLTYGLTHIGNIFNINIKNNFERVKELIKVYKSTFQLTPYLDFRWRNLSSGQSALFNIYSRLYTKSDSQTITKLNNDIFIMIDEADTYLHPRWSQTMVQSIIDFVSDIYTSETNTIQRQIQIVFTSNSPFIAADIPSSNVIFLKREKISEDNYRVFSQNSLTDKKETFGANIHTLLLDSFFLPFGSLSEFAKNKIEQVIERLNSPKAYSSKEDKETLRKIIGIIGEPVIKKKLLQMYNDRYNIDIDDRIQNLESELAILKNNKKK